MHTFYKTRWLFVFALSIGLAAAPTFAPTAMATIQEKAESETSEDDSTTQESEDEEDKSGDDNSDKKKPGNKKPKPKSPPGTNVGEQIKEIVGTDVEGEDFALSDYEGKVIMLDFWGDW